MLKHTDLILHILAGLCTHVRNKDAIPHVSLEVPSTAPSDALVMYVFLSLIAPLIQFEFTFPYEDLLSQSLELSPPRYGWTWGN